jgi:hypothetical protein
MLSRMSGAGDDLLIYVHFIDAATGETFIEAEVPAGQLPESFEQPLGLDLNEDGKWEVVKAEPPTAAKFRASGQLKLTLRQASPATPDDILFSLPTIESCTPALAEGSSSAGKDAFALHEDGWRQVEFVALRHQDAIGRCLSAIRRVHAEAWTGMGFKTLHVRREVPRPLEGLALSLETVGRIVPGSRALGGLTYEGARGLIAGGFAFVLPSSVRLFGLAEEAPAGALTVLGVAPGDRPGPAAAEAEALADFAAPHGLCLVDWCRATQVPAEREAFVRYFSGKS